MRSHLLEGWSATAGPGRSCTRLEHDVYYVALDLDELDEVDRVAPARSGGTAPEPASVPRRAITSSRRRPTCATAFLDHLRAEGEDPDGWQITLVTNLRVFGYVFNPASFYLCRDADGVLRVVVVEVHNTHGERHLYTLRPRDGGSDTFVATMDKAFYVSPFIEMRGRLHGPGPRRAVTAAHLASTSTRPRASLLHASLDLARRPLTDRTCCGCSSDTRSSPTDDRPHPLARPAPVAARRPLPSTSRGRPMTIPRSPVQRVDRAPSRPRTAMAAWRVALAAAERIRIGRLTRRPARRLRRRSSATIEAERQRRDPDPRPRGRSSACSAAARPAPARRTWTACGPARTCRRCCGSPRGTARPWRCSAAGSASRRSSPRTVAHRARRNTRRGQPAEHRRPLRPRQRLLPAVPRRDDDLLERGLRRPPTSRWPMRSGTSTGGSRPTPELRAGQHVLEIGTGWGGFALYAAGELGCRVTTITISREQYELARAARPRCRPRPPGRRPAARLPRHRGHVRRHRLDRDARGGRRRVPRDVLRGVRSGVAARAAG